MKVRRLRAQQLTQGDRMLALRATVRVRIGPSGRPRDSATLLIDPHTIANVTEFAGSLHVRSMDLHFEDYVLRDARIALTRPRALPPVSQFTSLRFKERSQDIVGNMGESIAGIVAIDYLHLQPADVAHLKVIAGVQTPDYVMRLGGELPESIAAVVREAPPDMPEWWPVESKASHNRHQTVKAFRQLLSYWEAIKNEYPQGVGYGLVVDLKYAPRRGGASILMTVFIPRDRNRLVTYLRRIRSKKKRSELLREAYRNTHIKECLYGS
jgi:hypothetical protein